MKSIERLKELYNERKKGCVSYGYDSNQKKYYAVNGLGTTNYLIIEEIIGDQPFFCGPDYSFTILDFDCLPSDYNPNMASFYNVLKYSSCQILNFPLKKAPVFYNRLNYEKKYKRYYTCAEKKGIGYFRINKEIKLNKLLTTKYPCFHCLPVIEKVHFLYNGYTIRRIEKTDISDTCFKFKFY